MKKNSLLIIKEHVGIVFHGDKLNSDELETYTNATKSVVLDFLEKSGRVIFEICDNADISDCSMAQII